MILKISEEKHMNCLWSLIEYFIQLKLLTWTRLCWLLVLNVGFDLIVDRLPSPYRWIVVISVEVTVVWNLSAPVHTRSSLFLISMSHTMDVNKRKLSLSSFFAALSALRCHLLFGGDITELHRQRSSVNTNSVTAMQPSCFFCFPPV